MKIRTIDRVVVALVVCFIGTQALADETALDRYIAKPDPTYSWKVVKEVAGNPATQYLIDFKSQTWRTEKDVDRTVWQHWLIVIKPAKPASQFAFLRITGGANGGEPPQAV